MKWVIRLAFLAALYLFLALVARTLLRDIRAASRDPAGALGRLVVIGSANLPTVGRVFLLDAVTTLGLSDCELVNVAPEGSVTENDFCPLRESVCDAATPD